ANNFALSHLNYDHLDLNDAARVGRGLILRPRIKRMLALFIEFVLELEALVVGLYSANGFDDGGNPIVHVPFAEIARGDRTVSGVVVGKAGVPPDAGVYIFGQVQAFLVGAGFGGGAFDVDQVGPRDHSVRGFVLTGVIIDACRFLWWPAGAASPAVENVNDIVVWPIELRLGKEGNQVLVPAVAVDNHNLLAALARHFIRRFLEQLQLQFHAIGDGSRFMLGFKNLSEVILWKDDSELLLRRLQGGVAHVEKIRTQRQMRPMFFQDAEGKQTRALGLLDGIAKIGGGQLFPFHRQFRLSVSGTNDDESHEQRADSCTL